jgi:hypothetical protein
LRIPKVAFKTYQRWETYVEVEPGVEYFIQVEAEAGRVLVKFTVDGKNLGYLEVGSLEEKVSSFHGLWVMMVARQGTEHSSPKSQVSTGPMLTRRHPSGQAR